MKTDTYAFESNDEGLSTENNNNNYKNKNLNKQSYTTLNFRCIVNIVYCSVYLFIYF